MVNKTITITMTVIITFSARSLTEDTIPYKPILHNWIYREIWSSQTDTPLPDNSTNQQSIMHIPAQSIFNSISDNHKFSWVHWGSQPTERYLYDIHLDSSDISDGLLEERGQRLEHFINRARVEPTLEQPTNAASELSCSLHCLYRSHCSHRSALIQ